MGISSEVLSAFIKSNEGCAVNEIKLKLYDEALTLCYGNASAAARMLGVSRSAMWKHANKWQPKNKPGE